MDQFVEKSGAWIRATAPESVSSAMYFSGIATGDSISHNSKRHLINGALLTVQGILVTRVDSVSCTRDLQTVEEADSAFRERLKFLVSDFPDPNLQHDLIWQLQSALRFTVLPGRGLAFILETLPYKKFRDFCRRCLEGLAKLSDLDRETQSVLQRALLRERCLFKCTLPKRPKPQKGLTTWLESIVAEVYDEFSGMALEQRRDFEASWAKGMELLPLSQIFGLSRVQARTGDHVATIVGCDVPIILRSVEGTGHFRVIGPAYVHCLMGGKAIGILPEIDITLC